MTTRTGLRLAERLRRTTAAAADLPALAAAVYTAVAREVPFDFACFATTDPATGLITWASKTRPLEVGDEEFAATEYGPPDVNSFAEIARRTPPVGVLSVDTGGDLDSCRRHRDYMAPRFGFTDELRTVFPSRGASWGALAMYRGAGDLPFTAADATRFVDVGEIVADAIQRCLFRGDGAPRPVEPSPTAPAVLIVDDRGGVTHLTPAAEAVVAELGGWDHGELPASVLAVVATARTRGEHTESRVRTSAGRWLSLRAAPLTGPPQRHDIVVTAEPTPRATLSRLALAAHGLTSREEDVALLVLQGADTRAISATLHLSPHTVQDHLKVVFAKVGVSSRRELTARLVLE
ncbi:helix-turn-helix transcriptional regulator [Actinomycetospora sp. TBRC 11914]|uniref:helix-turn-helix transcriptional regulator n=1 Tax=Actinomycetospora sp. TBRC 11914 TaxID=2729387 RepID=UPI00145D32E8|nr:helix-turn-helix transcriptional regulator [Actinomycetospora sp. TBRC 11914]NMO89963.1 helix-turn-helix transcriptional regulator [Actinomycetospora sp. TBRC 11914]